MIVRAPLRGTIRAAVLAGLSCAAAPVAIAQAIPTANPTASGISPEQDLSLSARLDALEKRNASLEAEVADLKAQRTDPAKGVRETQAVPPTVALASGRPTLATADGNFKFALRSVVQFDAAAYSERPRTAANDLGSGTNFRRVRFGFDGTAYGDWNYGLLGEFGGSGGEVAGLNQAYLEYAGWKPFGLAEPVRLRVGAWATPAGLEDATSNTEELFLERAAIAELVRGLATGDGRTGVGATARGARWYASGLLSGKVVGAPATAETDQQRGFAARLAFNPIHGADYDLHIGANIQGILDPADTTAGPISTRTVRLQERPESRVSGVRLVDTGAINSDGLTAYGLEAGATWKNLYGSAEWYRVDVNRRATGPAVSPFDPSFSGWYLQGAWTITGEHRAWTNANGGFVGIRPAKAFSLQRGTWGAWELAARYSQLDLNDHDGVAGAPAPAGGVRGGGQKISTVGLNWYPNNAVRFLLDYQWVRVDRLGLTGLPVGEDVGVVSLRSQFAF